MATKNKKRMLLWGVASLVGIVMLALAMAPQPVAVDVETLARGPLRVTLDHEGKTRLREPFVVSSPVAGRLQRIVLEPGDAVTEGETVVAIIEPASPDPLDARDRAEAAAAVEAAQASVAETQADVARAKARNALAEDDRERVAQLAAEQVVSSRDLQSAKTEALAATEALHMAQAANRRAMYELKRARARLAEPEQISGGTVLVRAPIDGVVLRRLRQSAAIVPRGEPLLEIGNPEGLEVIADFLSTDAARIRPGMTALIERWGGDGSLQGKVRRVDPAGFTKISALGVEEQRVNVVVDLVEPRSAWASLGEAFRVEVRIVISDAASVPTVPASSLFRHNGGWAVFKVEGSRAQTVPVEIGQTNGRRSQVVSGLEAGDGVVTHPPESLEDGARVKERSL